MPFSTLANIKGSLPTKTTTPDWLRWRTKTDSADFLVLGGQNREKKFFQKVRYLVVIYTPKEAHSQIFVTGGEVFAREMLAKKVFWGGQLV